MQSLMPFGCPWVISKTSLNLTNSPLAYAWMYCGLFMLWYIMIDVLAVALAKEKGLLLVAVLTTLYTHCAFWWKITRVSYKLKHGRLVDTFIEEATQKRPREHRMCIKQKQNISSSSFLRNHRLLRHLLNLCGWYILCSALNRTIHLAK